MGGRFARQLVDISTALPALFYTCAADQIRYNSITMEERLQKLLAQGTCEKGIPRIDRSVQAA